MNLFGKAWTFGDHTKEETCQAQPLPEFAQETMAAGGLMKYVARKKGLVA